MDFKDIPFDPAVNKILNDTITGLKLKHKRVLRRRHHFSPTNERELVEVPAEMPATQGALDIFEERLENAAERAGDEQVARVRNTETVKGWWDRGKWALGGVAATLGTIGIIKFFSEFFGGSKKGGDE